MPCLIEHQNHQNII